MLICVYSKICSEHGLTFCTRVTLILRLYIILLLQITYVRTISVMCWYTQASIGRHKPSERSIDRCNNRIIRSRRQCYVVRLYYTGWACPVHYNNQENHQPILRTSITSQKAVCSCNGSKMEPSPSVCLPAHPACSVEYQESIMTAPHCRDTCAPVRECLPLH